MDKKKYWLWVDGQKRYYDYPVDPPGYTLEQWNILFVNQKDSYVNNLNCDSK